MPSSESTLLVIDVQKAFDNPRWGQRNNQECEANIARILKAWREAGCSVIHVYHQSEGAESLFSMGQPGFEVKAVAAPLADEPVFIKRVNSAFIGTSLEQHLRDQRIERLVLVGITTDHCVSTSARMAGNLGFVVTVVSDATCTFERGGPNGRHWSAKDMHESALASLNEEFAEIVSTDALVRWSIGATSRRHRKKGVASCPISKS